MSILCRILRITSKISCFDVIKGCKFPPLLPGSRLFRIGSRSSCITVFQNCQKYAYFAECNLTQALVYICITRGGLWLSTTIIKLWFSGRVFRLLLSPLLLFSSTFLPGLFFFFFLKWSQIFFFFLQVKWVIFFFFYYFWVTFFFFYSESGSSFFFSKNFHAPPPPGNLMVRP